MAGGLGGGERSGAGEQERAGRRREQRGSSETRGLVNCQLDSLTPFRGEQTNRGISQADSVDPSS